MQPFIEQAHLYRSYHQKPLTRYLSMFGVICLILSMMILLGWIHIVIPGILNINLADIAIVVLLIYYFRLNWRLAALLTPILLVLLLLAILFSYKGPTAFALWSFFILFIIGLGLQMTGYLLEENHPTFSDNIGHLLIAPPILVAELAFLTGRMQDLQASLSHPVEIVDKNHL